MAALPLSGLRIVKGHEVLRLYQFNTMTAKHYFCSNCGIYTHHQRRSKPNQYCYNVGCLDNVNPFDIPRCTEQAMASTIHQTVVPHNQRLERP